MHHCWRAWRPFLLRADPVGLRCSAWGRTTCCAAMHRACALRHVTPLLPHPRTHRSPQPQPTPLPAQHEHRAGGLPQPGRAHLRCSHDVPVLQAHQSRHQGGCQGRGAHCRWGPRVCLLDSAPRMWPCCFILQAYRPQLPSKWVAERRFKCRVAPPWPSMVASGLSHPCNKAQHTTFPSYTRGAGRSLPGRPARRRACRGQRHGRRLVRPLRRERQRGQWALRAVHRGAAALPGWGLCGGGGDAGGQPDRGGRG